MTKFKDRKIGKFIWGVGDALKGKGKAGKVADAVFEILPIPNPVRIVRDSVKEDALQALAESQEIRELAHKAGVELIELVDDSPKWLQPTLAIIIVVGILILVGTGAIDGVFFGQFIKSIFGI
jgi:hypothetical protein